MKKITRNIIALTVVLSLFSSVALADTSSNGQITLNKDIGTISIDVGNMDYSQFKVIIEKEEQKYTYNMYSSKVDLPLQMGSGVYEIGVYKKIEGNKYRKINSRKVRVNIDEVNVFLQDTQEVMVNSSKDTILRAKELTVLDKDNKELSDMEKLERVYNYVVDNVEYDNEKAKNMGNRYLPDSDQTLQTNKGICYDYSSLMAVMLRSLDIPTKLDKGYSTYTSSYHAWNEVYIDGNWLIVDTTTDASLIKEGMKTNMVKNDSDYSVKYEF